MSWHGEIHDAWLEAWIGAAPGMLGLACTGAAIMWLARRMPTPALRRACAVLATVAAGAGLALVVARAALYDDAFISFRYAANWAAGHGPVFNAGEHVEGYTNFLWTALLALLARIGPWGPPELALVLCPAVYLGCLAVTWRISRVLGSERALPFATVLLAVQATFVDYGTSGLETELAYLFVALGLLRLLTASTARQVGLSGLCMILAALTRPDHGLFYAVGSVVVLASFGGDIWHARSRGPRAMWREGGVLLASWGAPFMLIVIHTLWRLSYYGQLLPNTYYAKSAGDSHFAQGLVYAHVFFAASHMWLVLLLLLWGLVRPATSTVRQRFRLFVLGSSVVYGAYVLEVGGDFMHGRFFVTLIPLFLLGAEVAVNEAADRAGRHGMLVAALAAALLVSTAGGLRLLPVRTTRWHLSDESSVYPVTRWFPPAIDHSNYRVGHALAKLQRAGLQPLVATSGVGMLGYYSRLPILDRVGLVDSTVAHQPLARRGRPGHEKIAVAAYVAARNPHFIRGGRSIPRRYRRLTRIDFLARGGGRGWRIYHYDRTLMARVRELLPDARFTDFERHLDRYLARASQLTREELTRDLAFFRRYYFDHNDDPKRLAALEQALARAGPPPAPAR